MDEQTILEKIKELIGKVAWRLFLWSISMTQEEYLTAIYKQESSRR